MRERLSAPEAANAIAKERYPAADLVILTGSVSIGRATPTSDLDIVVVSMEDDEAPYRESFTALGWPAEGFVHTPDSVRSFIRMELADRECWMARMVSSGLVIRDPGKLADVLRAEAQAVIDAGPPPASEEELRNRRHGVTDLLDDVRGDPDGDETLLTAASLPTEVAALHLTISGAWLGGTGKWLLRELRETDPPFADRFVSAMRAHAAGDPTQLISLAIDVLDASGGPLFDGFGESGKARLEKFEQDEAQRASS